MHSIAEELREAWSSCFPDGSQPPDLFQLRAFRPNIRLLATEEQIDALQPWFSIVEVAVDLLFNLQLSLAAPTSGLPEEDSDKVPWALTGAASVFGASLLLSCAAGYDGPAKAQLRTYTETLLLLVATLHSPPLAADYFAAKTEQRVLDFWHKQASPKRLHERIIAIEKELGYTQKEIDALTAWRRREYEVLSQSSHLSLLGAVMTSMSPSVDNPHLHRLRAFGGPTLASRRTLGYAATSTWHCLRLVREQLSPLGKSSLFSAKSKLPLAPTILAGWYALETVVPKYLTSDVSAERDA